MGSLLNLVDFKHSSKARNSSNHDRHDCGFEAPRNSLEMPADTLRSSYAGKFTLPYVYGDSNDWTDDYLPEAPMKKLISDEISKKPNSRHSSPSVVARLMGVDMLPADTKPTRQQVESRSEIHLLNFPKQKHLRTSSGNHVSFTSNSIGRKKDDPLDRKQANGGYHRKSNLNPNKPKPREHPQDEELKKFKKEFEAFQAARFKEYAKAIELGSLPTQWLAQEDLNKEKMALYANSKRSVDGRRPKEKIVHDVPTSQQRRGDLQQKVKKCEAFAADLDSLGFCSKTSSPDLQQWSQTSSEDTSSNFVAPSKIVILKPGVESNGYNEESWASSSGISEDRGSIEDFLEEVKERLKNELQGKSSKKSTMVRGGGIETPYSEKPSDAIQARETTTVGTMLPRSSSTRSNRNEIQYNDVSSPEFIPRDTRRFLSERLRNVLKEEKHQDDPKSVLGSPRLSKLKNRSRADHQSVNDLNAGNRRRGWDSVANDSDKQNRSFRQDLDDNATHQEEPSPRNLIRSLSAPVSGTSFGKLLLEDRHIITGAHIRRKHEVIGEKTMNVKSRKKERFSFREKVSSFRYSLTLRGRLFGRKISSSEEAHCNNVILQDIASGPTIMMNCYDRLENSTEVPPSPASICSSAHEEFWRAADCFSPTSTADMNSIEDSMMPQVFRDIGSNLNELRKQLHQLEAEGSEATDVDELHNEFEMTEIEDKVEAYIRDLLVASGLYDGSCETSLSRWDPLGKPISKQVFEDVEDSYKQGIIKDDDEEVSSKDECDRLNHKILYDLLNEVLPTALGTPAPMSRLWKQAAGHITGPLRGKKLLNHVWETISGLVNPPEDALYHSIDHMVARDLQSSLWGKGIEDDVNVLAKEIEFHIIGDLIEEMVKNDLQSTSF